MPLRRLAVFIGENDAGKSGLLDAVRIVVTDAKPALSDYRQISYGNSVDEISLEARFMLEKHDFVPPEVLTLDLRHLVVRKSFNKNGTSRVEILTKKPKDERFEKFAGLDANTQKDLLSEIGLEPAANKESRVSQFEQAVRKGTVETYEGFVTVAFTILAEYLPRFELTSATDFEQPHLLVQKTLQAVVSACIKQSSDEKSPGALIPELDAAHKKIETSLNEKLSEAKQALEVIYPRVREIAVSPRIDFSKSVQIPELLLDCDDGQGPKPISSFGDGTKKRMWMGLLDWQRNTENEVATSAVIRAFDEPDMSLHYDAQRKLFSNLIESTSKTDSKTQVLVCTHSLPLVDRAPGGSINLIKLTDDGRTIEFLKGDSDPDVKQFLDSVSRSIGISNSALFYERAFLIVEGPSEENALPVLYRNLYKHTLVEDGIVLVNLDGSGNWQPFLKLLGANKSSSTVLLLDSDCQADGSGTRVTPSKLLSIGFDTQFIANNVFFIGDKEFEDSFNTRDIMGVLNTYYPKAEGGVWCADKDIDIHRGSNFMKNLMRHVEQNAKPGIDRLRKPEFSVRLASSCLKEEQIPDAIKKVFEMARRVAEVP